MGGRGSGSRMQRNGSSTDAPLSKSEQLEIILDANPAEDDIHTWIRDESDIHTFQEVVDDEGIYDQTPDYSAEDIEDALRTGKITVYSSKPIENGNFVTPSRMEAEQYAGRGGRVYSETVNVSDVAWVDMLQGQLARRKR